MNPRKAPAIKVEIEKLLKDGFIYPIPLMKWISNPVPVDKKQGAIRICTNFYDLNRSCPRIISPHHLLIIFWMSVPGVRYFPLWMVFPDIIKFKLILRINIRPHLFVLRVLLHIERCLSALRMPKLHFSRL